MNGATALDCENTIRRPNSTKTTTIGTSQYFFSCRRNCQNSVRTRFLLMATSEHAFVMFTIAISSGIRRPSRPRVAAPRQRVLSREAPDQGDGHEPDDEQDRQQHAGVDVAQRAREPPPRGARIFQERRVDEPGHEQEAAEEGGDLGARDAATPPERRRDRAQDESDR